MPNMPYVGFKCKHTLVLIIVLVAIFVTVNYAIPTYNLENPIGIGTLQKRQDPAPEEDAPKDEPKDDAPKDDAPKDEPKDEPKNEPKEEPKNEAPKDEPKNEPKEEPKE